MGRRSDLYVRTPRYNLTSGLPRRHPCSPTLRRKPTLGSASTSMCLRRRSRRMARLTCMMSVAGIDCSFAERLEACHTPCFCPLSCHASQTHRCSHTDANQGRLPWKEQFLKNVHKKCRLQEKEPASGVSVPLLDTKTLQKRMQHRGAISGWVGLDWMHLWVR